MAEPRRGPGYVSPTGTDVPVFWDITLLFTRDEAARFQLWFTIDLERGVQDFTLPIRTEFGLIEHTCRFLPDSLLPAGEEGELYRYTATITTRAQIVPDAAADAWAGAFDGPIPDQQVYGGIAFSLDLTPFWDGGSGSGYSWSVAAGTLPPGLALNPATGAISGTWTGPASTTFSGLVFRRTDLYGIARDSNEVDFTATIIEPDAMFSSVLMLLHGDGANGSTTFTDSSSYGRTIAISGGSPTNSTVQKRVGTGSIYGGTAATELTTSESGSEWNQDSWTLDFHYRRSSDGNYHGFFYFNANLIFRLDGASGGATYRGRLLLDGATLLTSTTAATLDTWRHFEVSVSRSGATRTVRIFVDGVLEATTTSTNANLGLAAGGGVLSVGRHDNGGFAGLHGYLDGWRLTAGVRHTANFTPPLFLGNYAAP